MKKRKTKGKRTPDKRVRTSISFPEELHRKLKILAIEKGVTLNEIVIVLLKERLKDLGLKK